MDRNDDGRGRMLGLLIKRERMAQNMSQQALCQGICAPSYLSKIENGAARCSDEMYALLFDALGIRFESDPALLDEFARAYAAFLDARLRRRWPMPQEAEALLGLCRRLRYSSRGIDAALVECLLEKTGGRQALDSLAVLRPAFTGEEALLYALAESAYCRGQRRYEQSAAWLEAVKSAAYPVVYWEQCADFFQMGAYCEAAENGEEAYRLYAAQGLARSMLDVGMILSAAYANAMAFERMQRWLSVCRNLNEVIGDGEVSLMLHYNEGASCLMFGEYERGLRCLEAGEALADLYGGENVVEANLYRQKLAFAYLFCGRPEDARETLARMRLPEAEGSVAASVALMRYMLDTPGYRETKAYGELLEECLLAAEKEARGRLEFYGRFLIDAYKATRQYKKAVDLIEKYKLSHLFQ